MAKKKKKSTGIDKRALLVQALVDLLIGTPLILIDKAIDQIAAGAGREIPATKS